MERSIIKGKRDSIISNNNDTGSSDRLKNRFTATLNMVHVLQNRRKMHDDYISECIQHYDAKLTSFCSLLYM